MKFFNSAKLFCYDSSTFSSKTTLPAFIACIIIILVFSVSYHRTTMIFSSINSTNCSIFMGILSDWRVRKIPHQAKRPTKWSTLFDLTWVETSWYWGQSLGRAASGAQREACLDPNSNQHYYLLTDILIVGKATGWTMVLIHHQHLLPSLFKPTRVFFLSTWVTMKNYLSSWTTCKWIGSSYLNWGHENPKLQNL